MNAAEFDRIMNTVQATYGHKISDATRVVVWERVLHIPSKHVDSIVARLCDFETLPKAFNIGKAILSAYAALDPSGAGLAGEEPGKWANSCPECDPGRWKGQIVYFTRSANGRILKHYIPCAVCQQSSVRKATRASLTAEGYMVPPSPADVGAWYFRMFRANNAEFAAAVEERMPMIGEMAQSLSVASVR